MSYYLEQLAGPERRAECDRNDVAMNIHFRRHPPFHNGKVWIGIAYVPKPQRIEGQDAIQLQSALLEPRTKREPSMFAKVFGRVLQWL